MIKFELFGLDKSPTFFQTLFPENQLSSALGRTFAKNEGCVRIVFSLGEEIRKLNRDFRQKDETTDVLSFNVNEGVELVDGEVYVCPDFIYHNVKSNLKGKYTDAQLERIVSVEILRMLVHGVLHLLGYDHKMHFEQDYFKNLEVDSTILEDTMSDDMYTKQEEILRRLVTEASPDR